MVRKKAMDFHNEKGESLNFAEKGRSEVLLRKGKAQTPWTDQPLQGPLLMTIVFRSNFDEKFPGRGATRGIRPYWDHSLGFHLRG